jgi:hypothetical protein
MAIERSLPARIVDSNPMDTTVPTNCRPRMRSKACATPPADPRRSQPNRSAERGGGADEGGCKEGQGAEARGSRGLEPLLTHRKQTAVFDQCDTLLDQAARTKLSRLASAKSWGHCAPFALPPPGPYRALHRSAAFDRAAIACDRNLLKCDYLVHIANMKNEYPYRKKDGTETSKSIRFSFKYRP